MMWAINLAVIGIVALVVIGGTLLWLAAIVECAQNESSTGNDKLVWLLVILFLHFIGALIYFLVRRPQRIRELGH